jgi:hypothetical protein
MAEPIKVSRGGVFVPSWGNADRDEADKIKVHYRFLSLDEEQRIVAESRREAGGDDDERLTEILSLQWIKRTTTMIESVENLQLDDGEVRDITTGEALFAEPALVNLGYEIMHAFKDFTAIDKKK